MMDLNAITQELIQKISVSGITVTLAQPNDFPAIVLGAPYSIRYANTSTGGCELTLRAQLMVNAADQASAIILLYQLLSYNLPDSTPLPDALLATATNYKSAQVVSASNFAFDDQKNLAVADITINVLT